MLESLIIALREGIEVALVLGILIAYLNKAQRTILIPSVYTGLGIAIVASIACAVVIDRLALDHEAFEGYLLLTAAIFVISMIVWMWMTAKRIRAEIERKVGDIVGNTITWRSYAGVLLFTFLMVVREGIETALFVQAVALSKGGLASILGTSIGLTAATVFAIFFIRGSLRIDISRFLRITAITLVIFSFQLIANALHEFFEYGVLPANPEMMGILGPVVQNNALFVLAIVLIPALMMVIPGRRSAGTPALTDRQRRWQLSAALASIAIVSFLGVGTIFSSDHEMDLSAEGLEVPETGIIQIPVAAVSDGNVHRFAIDDRGLEIRFFVLRVGIGKLATAFDACYACYSYGRYYIKSGELICSQCVAPTPFSRLRPAMIADEPDEENSGSMEGNGCTPIFLPSKIQDGNVEITLADLQKQRKYFDIGPE